MRSYKWHGGLTGLDEWSHMPYGELRRKAGYVQFSVDNKAKLWIEDEDGNGVEIPFPDPQTAIDAANYLVDKMSANKNTPPHC